MRRARLRHARLRHARVRRARLRHACVRRALPRSHAFPSSLRSTSAVRAALPSGPDQRKSEMIMRIILISKDGLTACRGNATAMYDWCKRIMACATVRFTA
ncbi:pentapeptide repeat-containing protein [Paraburkholderia sp. EG287A]|uniref:pentapeptide repeat-containing protein n=1 Tax=unclassified Paraburkholderia TaxID=2615204 RepID=UPI0034D32FDB